MSPAWLMRPQQVRPRFQRGFEVLEFADLRAAAPNPVHTPSSENRVNALGKSFLSRPPPALAERLPTYRRPGSEVKCAGASTCWRRTAAVRAKRRGAKPFAFQQSRDVQDLQCRGLFATEFFDVLCCEPIQSVRHQWAQVNKWLGRAETAAAHIRPVEKNGPDMSITGSPFRGTVHWMFDRGLISLSDECRFRFHDRQRFREYSNPCQQERQRPAASGAYRPSASSFFPTAS